MSHNAEDEPNVRVRRKMVLPARYEDYDLTGFNLPKAVSQPMLPLTSSTQRAKCTEKEQAAPHIPKLPEFGFDSPHPLSDEEQWETRSDKLKRENEEMRKSYDKMQHTLQMVQQERDTFQSKNDQYEQELTELKQQMKQLQSQMRQQHGTVQFLSPIIPSRQHSPSHPIPAPRVHVYAKSDDISFRPVPVPSLRSQRDRLTVPTQHSTPAVAPRTKLSPSPYHIPQGAHASVEDDSQDPTSRHTSRWDPYSTPKDYEIPCQPHSPSPPPEQEVMYRGPAPTIPDFVRPNPREFARLKLALDNILPAQATERFKFQILMDHLKLEEALLIADSYSHSQYPYSKTMAALNQQYGQPHQLALQRIAELMDGPNIASGDIKAFRLFALKVRSLVGMLEQLGSDGSYELQCGSHVSRLLGKLPHDLRSGFRRFAHPQSVPIPTLLDLSDWLEFEIEVQEDSTRFAIDNRRAPVSRNRETYQLITVPTSSSSQLIKSEAG